MKRLLLLATGLLLLLAFPATGSATTGNGILYTGPVQVRAYKMTLLAVAKSAHSPASLIVVFTRGTESDRQLHYYEFTHGVKVSIAAGGVAGSIRADLGVYGKIDMSFSPGGGGRNTPGCQGGLFSFHPGTLAGSPGFKFVTHSSYFGTVRSKSFAGYTAYVRPGFNCKPQVTKPSHGTELTADAVTIPGTGSGGPTVGRQIDFEATRSKSGFVVQQFLVLVPPSSPSEPVIIHVVDRSSLPRSAFRNAADLSSAQAVALGIFLSGNLSFTRTIALSPTIASGTVAGTMTARFDGVGIVKLPTSAQGTLTTK